MKYTLTFILFCTMAGCSSQGNHPSTSSGSDPTILRLTSEADTQIAVERPSVQDLKDEISLAGRADFSPDLVTRVYSLVNGVVRTVDVSQGVFVHKGDILAEVYSSDFDAAVSDYHKASAQLKTAEKNMARSRGLAEAMIISQRELQQALNDSAQAKAEYDRAAGVLDLLGGSRDSTSSLLRIRAPIDGYVLERTAQIGSQVRSDNSQTLFTIGRIHSLWIILDVYQDQFSRIAVGDKVSLSFDGLGDTVISSVIRYVSPTLDPVTMTGKARCDISNPDGRIRPSMFCSANVFHRRGRTVLVPASSTVYDGDGKTYVFEKLDVGVYKKREVRVGRKFRDMLEVLSGISPSEQIVTRQAVFLNEEMQLAAR